MMPKLALLALGTLAMARVAVLAAPAIPSHPWPWRPPPLSSITSWPQRPPSPGVRHWPCIEGGVFDPASLETFKGTVTQVDIYDGHPGLFFLLQTPEEAIEVHLGPAWYLESRNCEIGLNQVVKVTGFRSDFNGRSVLMAAEIIQADRLWSHPDLSYPPWELPHAP